MGGDVASNVPYFLGESRMSLYKAEIAHQAKF